MNELFFQGLCADVINDYCSTGNHSECEIVRRCFETFRGLDTYKKVWFLKPWIVGVMLLRLGMMIERTNPADGRNVNGVWQKGKSTPTESKESGRTCLE